MANTKSAKKRIRTNEHKHNRNQSYRSPVKTLVRKAEQVIAAGADSVDAVKAAMSTLDKAGTKGILHKNNIARRKSRLARKAKAAALAA